jgi:hypothetical protein
MSAAHTKHLISLMPGNTRVSDVDIERLVSSVLPDDRVLVTNIITTLQVLRGPQNHLCSNYEIVRNSKGYDLIATLSNSLKKEFTVSHNDMEIIQSVSIPRINSIFVQLSNESIELVVRIYNSTFPVVYNSVQLHTIHKRARIM